MDLEKFSKEQLMEGVREANAILARHRVSVVESIPLLKQLESEIQRGNIQQAVHVCQLLRKAQEMVLTHPDYLRISSLENPS